MIGQGDLGANLGPSGGGHHRLTPPSSVALVRGARKHKELPLIPRPGGSAASELEIVVCPTSTFTFLGSPSHVNE